MSLRWRLSLALAALAALATVATASIAYASTRQRLDTEIDRALTERAETVASLVRSGAERRGPLIMSFGTAALLDPDTVLRLLDADGAVIAANAALDLPVEVPVATAGPGDAAGSGQTDRPDGAAGRRERTRLATVELDGTRYRLVTLSLERGAVQTARALTERDRVLTGLQRQFALVGAGVVAVAAGLGLHIARRSTRALEALTTSAERVAATGDPTLPVPIPAREADETGRLARSMATMLAALARSRQQQRDLVDDAGHELRTPITSLRTNLDVLARHPDLPAAQRGAVVAELRAELGELSLLIDELVAVAAEGPDREDPEPVVLRALVERVAERVGRRHGRTIEVIGDRATVSAPPVALGRAVGNLLENAVKFSPDGTVVQAAVHGGRLEVRDHGPGIAVDDAARVFDRFYRSAEARSLPGSGLGLAIVRQVVESCGGRVYVVPGTGAGVVGFDLPVASHGVGATERSITPAPPAGGPEPSRPAGQSSSST
ncbi:MAG: ATP-binding protein [Acidimicrobiia bacterium]